MRSVEFSREDEIRAELIHKRALWIGWFLFIGFCVVVGFVADKLSSIPHIEFISGGLVGWAPYIQDTFASQQIHRAGLSRERVEKHTVPKTMTNFEGEPLVLRSRSDMRVSWSWLVVLCILLVILTIVQTSRTPLPLLAGGVLYVVLLGFAASYIHRIFRPLVLLLRKGGVEGECAPFRWRCVPWERITAFEVKQSFDYMGKPSPKTLAFLDNTGKPIVESQSPLTALKPEEVDAFISQVEAKMRGDKILSA